VLGIWHDTTWKLALLFLPLAAFLMVDRPRRFIVFLFTSAITASAPIFMVWSAMILLASLQVDGVMRVFAQTRFLLVLKLDAPGDYRRADPLVSCGVSLCSARPW